MRSHDEKRRWALPFALMLSFGMAFLFFLFVPTAVHAASISGDSTTILRMGRTMGDKNLYPLYEYLNFGVSNELANGVLSGNAGGWGRVDLRDRSTDTNPDAKLQYGSVSYSGNNNNLLLKAGRQFITEGVAAERLDGLYVRSDFAFGFGAAAFVGSPVVTESNFKGGDVTYGGRLIHSIPQYYTIGVSYLRTDYDNDRIREEAGIDIWIHPLQKADLVGRSSYNSITSRWMEHAYTLTVNPLDILRITADMSYIKYKDYFYQVTTSALSLKNGILNPNEEVLSVGGSIELFLLTNTLRIAADFKNYDYDIAGQTNYYGGKATYSPTDSFATGISLHRMDGENDRFRYNEYRLFATKRLGKADLTADIFDLKYDDSINGIENTYSASAAIGYQCTEGIKVSADINYMRSIDFDRDVRGLVKLTWSFDKEFGRKGGQSEK